LLAPNACSVAAGRYTTSRLGDTSVTRTRPANSARIPSTVSTAAKPPPATTTCGRPRLPSERDMLHTMDLPAPPSIRKLPLRIPRKPLIAQSQTTPSAERRSARPVHRRCGQARTTGPHRGSTVLTWDRSTERGGRQGDLARDWLPRRSTTAGAGAPRAASLGAPSCFPASPATRALSATPCSFRGAASSRNARSPDPPRTGCRRRRRINPSAWDSHPAWDIWSVYQPKYPTLRFGVDVAAGPGVQRPVQTSERPDLPAGRPTVDRGGAQHLHRRPRVVLEPSPDGILAVRLDDGPNSKSSYAR
jgi:hypothetical protein